MEAADPDSERKERVHYRCGEFFLLAFGIAGYISLLPLSIPLLLPKFLGRTIQHISDIISSKAMFKFKLVAD